MFEVLSILPTAAPLSVMPSSTVTDMVDGNFIHDVIAVAAPNPLVHAKGTVNEERISDTLSVIGAFYLRTSVYFLRTSIPSHAHDSAYHLHTFFTPHLN